MAEQLKAALAVQRPHEGAANGNGAAAGTVPAWWAPNNPYTVRTDIADLLNESSTGPRGDS